jgi:signal peptidase I
VTFQQIRERLDAGEMVVTRLSGNSMTPRIHSGDSVTIRPFRTAEGLEYHGLRKGDVVFCKVRGSYFLHLVTGLRVDRVQISNNHGHVNGWTTYSNVYGILSSVSR